VAVAATGGHDSPQTNPPVSSSPTNPTGSTTSGTPGPSTSSTSSTSTSPATPTSTPTSADSLPAPDPGPTTATEPDGVKAGCAEASRDLDAFNAANPAAHGNKQFQIKADRDLASNLAADARMATDPAVKSAIQSEADSWNRFADYYEKGDTKGMSNTIPQTSNAISAVNKACSS
jgi:hypothetical protein